MFSKIRRQSLPSGPCIMLKILSSNFYPKLMHYPAVIGFRIKKKEFDFCNL